MISQKEIKKVEMGTWMSGGMKAKPKNKDQPAKTRKK